MLRAPEAAQPPRDSLLLVSDIRCPDALQTLHRKEEEYVVPHAAPDS